MWLKRQLEACEGNEKRYVRTRIDVIFLVPVFLRSWFRFTFLRACCCDDERASERANERANGGSVFFFFFFLERTAECKTHCKVVEPAGKKDEEGRKEGRKEQNDAEGRARSYYGNTHARTRVFRFLWRAGSLHGTMAHRSIA